MPPSANVEIGFAIYLVAQSQTSTFKLAQQFADFVGGDVITGEHQGLDGPWCKRMIAAIITEVPDTNEQQASHGAAGHDLLT
ncbi:hypothetical protein D3C84_1091160 [compost metagenome]